MTITKLVRWDLYSFWTRQIFIHDVRFITAPLNRPQIRRSVAYSTSCRTNEGFGVRSECQRTNSSHNSNVFSQSAVCWALRATVLPLQTWAPAGNRGGASEVLSPLKAAAVMTSSRLHHASSLIALQESCLLCVLTSAQCANVLMEIMMHTLRRFLLQGFFFFFFFSPLTHTQKKNDEFRSFRLFSASCRSLLWDHTCCVIVRRFEEVWSHQWL